MSRKAAQLAEDIVQPMFSRPPFSLGFPSDSTKSAYYVGTSRMSKDEISFVSSVMERERIHQENSRIQKTESNGTIFYLQVRGFCRERQ